MIPHLNGRAQSLAPLGWTGRDAEWLALVCLHSIDGGDVLTAIRAVPCSTKTRRHGRQYPMTERLNDRP